MQGLRAIVLLLCGSLAGFCCPLAVCAAAQARSDSLPQDAYVWQRSWTPAVQAAVSEHASEFNGLIVLAAEVTWQGRQPRLIRVPLDHKALAVLQCKIGLAIRVGPYPGPFTASGEPIESMGQLIKGLIAQARSGGVEPSEIQIDFDCADSKLTGYRVWLQALRKQAGRVPLTITALPSWLRQPAFKELARASDGYVLQVHSLERPKGLTDPYSLCDPAAARRAADQADRLGVGFRIALPTYAYQLAFDQSGKFVGLSAESRAVPWPRDVQVRRVGAEPQTLAGLVRYWTTNRLHGLAGVIWYRLPTAADALNWPWETLAAVKSGHPPRTELRVEANRVQAGLIEVTMHNRGQTALATPPSVHVRWTNARLIAGDALNGYSFEEQGRLKARLWFAPTGSWSRMNPGDRRAIAWLRLSKDEEVEVQLEAGGESGPSN